MVKLGDIGTLERGNGLQKKDFTEDGIGCIHYGQIYTRYNLFVYDTISHVNEDLGKRLLKVEKGNLVIACTSENVEDVCKCVVWLGDETIVTGGHSVVYRHKEDPKYIAYCFQTEGFKAQKRKYAFGAKVIDIRVEKLAQIVIPLPPLPVQQEIVRILDSFTDLQDNLQQELEARKKQYEAYREKLLSFNEIGGGTRKIGEFCEVLRGKRLTKDMLSDNEHYPVFHGGLEPLGYYSRNNREGDSVMVINVGASAGTIGYSPVDFWSSDGCYCLSKSNDVNSRFLYYALLGKEKLIKGKVRHAGIPTLDARVVAEISVPIPPFEKQLEIVEILDVFDKTITNISDELSARQKQYEYYREQLLTF